MAQEICFIPSTRKKKKQEKIILLKKLCLFSVINVTQHKGVIDMTDFIKCLLEFVKGTKFFLGLTLVR